MSRFPSAPLLSPTISSNCSLAGTSSMPSPRASSRSTRRTSGGVLKMPDFASPASMSIHEEITRAAINALMPVFSTLVLFDQHKTQNTIDTIVPDLAESWSWDAAKTALTFKLRHGVKWHDGKPFTAADVKCTWELLQGKAIEKLRLNPRKSWHRNLDAVTINGDD